MRSPGRTTVCLSSQAGCGMACPFCATGQGGVTCNLSTAEITDQVVRAGEKVTNVVFIGMGVTQRAVFTTHPAPVLTRRFRRPCTSCSVERAVAGQSSRATASPKGSQMLTCACAPRPNQTHQTVAGLPRPTDGPPRARTGPRPGPASRPGRSWKRCWRPAARRTPPTPP